MRRTSWVRLVSITLPPLLVLTTLGVSSLVLAPPEGPSGALFFSPAVATTYTHTVKDCSAVETCTSTAITTGPYSTLIAFVTATSVTAPSGLSSSPSHSWTTEGSASSSTTTDREVYVYATNNVSSASTTVTATFAASTTYDILVIDLGNTTASAVDAVGTGATGSAATSGTPAKASISTTVSPTVANDVIVGACGLNDTAGVAGFVASWSGQTIVNSVGASGFQSAADTYQTSNGTGAQTIKFEIESSAAHTYYYACIDLALKSASVPSAPTSLTAGTVTSSQIPLTWTDGAGVVVNETVSQALYSGGSCGSYSTHYSTGGKLQAYTVTGLPASTAYCFEVTAWNTTGQSSASTPLTDVVTKAALTGTFTISPATFEAGHAGNFTSTVSGGVSPYTLAWAFGDGGTSSATNPTHSYSSAGTYTAYLNVTDAVSETSTYHASVTVVVALTASFVVSPTSPDAGSAATFTSTVLHGVTPYSYSWHFGDGGTSTSANPTHMFASAGSYHVYLNVTDASSIVYSYEVTVSVNAALSASFIISPTISEVGLSTVFTSTVSGGTKPYSYQWSFGDHTTATTANATHTYTTAGTYTVYFNVTDADSILVSVSHSLTVEGILTVSFSVSPTSPEVGHVATFTSTVSGGVTPYVYAWSFGDHTTSALADPTHTYSAAGTYAVYLNVTDANAVTVFTSASVVVAAAVSVSFVFSPSHPVYGESVLFTSTVTGGVAPFVYAWAFGDTGTSTSADPTHAYGSAGSFVVYLNLTDADGGAATYHLTVVVGIPVFPPYDLSVVRGVTTLDLSWVLPTNQTNQNITLYLGFVCGNWSDTTVEPSSTLTYTWSGLAPSTGYCVGVATRVDGVESSIPVLTTTTEVEVPVVVSFAAPRVTATSVYLTWTIEYPFTNVTLFVSDDGCLIYASISEGPNSSATVSNLTPATTACFKIEPWNGTTAGSVSPQLNATTLPAPPAPPSPTGWAYLRSLPWPFYAVLGIIGVGFLGVMVASRGRR